MRRIIPEWCGLCVVMVLMLLNPIFAEEIASSVLNPVFTAIEKTLSEKKTPILVFDLDGTLFDTAQRQVRILREWAKENSSNPDAKLLENVTEKDTDYGIGSIAVKLGVKNEASLASIFNFWFKRFFTNEYAAIDAPIPGGQTFIKKCVEKGALIVYLTGRDIPQMGKGTQESLVKNGFPLDGKIAQLLLKPERHVDDHEFKKDACATIGKLGSVVGIFENQPRNLNALAKAFPEAVTVFIETNYDPRDTETPSEKAIRIKNY